TPSGVVVRDLVSGLDTRLTFERHAYDTPSWFPTGDQIVYLTDVAMTRATAPTAVGTSFLGTVIAQRADGTDRARALTTASALPRVTPDGKSLVFIVDDTGRGRLRVAPIGRDGSIGPAHSRGAADHAGHRSRTPCRSRAELDGSSGRQPIGVAVFRGGLKNGVFTTVAGTRCRTASTVTSTSSVVPSATCGADTVASA